MVHWLAVTHINICGQKARFILKALVNSRCQYSQVRPQPRAVGGCGPAHILQLIHAAFAILKSANFEL